MKDLEKKIEGAAINMAAKIDKNQPYLFEKGWIMGSKSPEAKEYWQQGMYSEEEVRKMCRKSHFVDQNIDDWFEQNKKKEPIESLDKDIRIQTCPVGSYEAENKVATCIGSDTCRELCKTCVNYHPL